MDLEKLSGDGKPCLMILPQSDLQAKSSSPSTSLMLLQLPEGFSPSDLKDSQFVVAKPEQQAVLVCKQKSFHLSKVETSNCLVMVPPLKESSGDEPQESPRKKAKHCDDDNAGTSTKTLHVVPTRLLKPGGSGASFLELKPKQLRLADLRQALAAAVLDPYNSSNNNDSSTTATIKGRSLSSLSHELQQSAHEVLQGLHKVPGVYSINNTFVLLSEEVQLTVYHAILSTLAEADDCQDYAETGIADIDGFVKQSVESMSDEERFEGVDGVIRHCLLQLAMDRRQEPLRLDVIKVSPGFILHSRIIADLNNCEICPF